MSGQLLGRKERISLAVLTAGLVAVLSVAAWLAPDPSGFRANLGGSMLFLVAALSVPWLAWVIWTASPRLRDQWGLFALSGSCVSMAIAMGLWAWNLVTTKLQIL
jgi:ABC-type Co2+ transport system permease subunit